jgi:hypothetical protein
MVRRNCCWRRWIFLCLKEKKVAASSEEPMPRARYDVLLAWLQRRLAKKAVASAALIA